MSCPLFVSRDYDYHSAYSESTSIVIGVGKKLLLFFYSNNIGSDVTSIALCFLTSDLDRMLYS